MPGGKGTVTTKQPDPQWLQRAQAIGKAQSRYLLILLVVMIFYLALQERVASAPTVKPMRVPIVDLEIGLGFVLYRGSKRNAAYIFVALRIQSLRDTPPIRWAKASIVSRSCGVNLTATTSERAVFAMQVTVNEQI